jgi:hypothetical protein
MITRPWTYDMPGWRYDSRYLRVMPAGGAPRTCGAGGSPGRDVDLVLFMVPPDSDVSTEGYCAPAPVIGIRFDGGAISEVSLLSTSTLDADGDITEPELDASMERLSAAQQFVSWARGHGPAPDFADRVRHFNGGLAPRWNDDPERRDGWSGCSGLGFPDCAIDPVGAIARYDGKVVAAPGRSTCPVDRTVPEPYASASDLVRLSVPEPASCGSAWVVELWIDARGRIYAVSQVGTATAQ